MKQKKQPTTSELLRTVESIVTKGTGIEERVKAEQALPTKYSGQDGIRYDPNWQDDIANPPHKRRK